MKVVVFMLNNPFFGVCSEIWNIFFGAVPRDTEGIFRGSSNGRTPGFGPGYLGSNPGPRAT